ncbi:MAG TPA: CRISPR-associated RAMP protein Csx7 [Anaerolineae bacterium]|jgi:CRISPR-associated RAMP protein (TIGR02581 family)
MMVVDFSTFHSRFRVTGVLNLNTAMRIGAGSAQGATEQDLAVLKDLTGRPYIPGSSFKGAYRAHLERLLRSFDPNLACISVPRTEGKGLGQVEGCLSQDDIEAIKKKFEDKTDLDLSQAILNGTTLTPKDDSRVKEDLQLTGLCWVCRLCGAPWFASKLMVRDMVVVEETWFKRYLIRDGVAIDRDTETAAEGLYFNFEAVPVGTKFRFEIIIDNADEAELGLALLGLREFEQGYVPLGGARSRGLGHVALQLDWDDSSLVKKEHLKEYLLDPGSAIALAQEEARADYWKKFVDELKESGGSSHAQTLSQ